jgi:hypothetical protein
LFSRWTLPSKPWSTAFSKKSIIVCTRQHCTFWR